MRKILVLIILFNSLLLLAQTKDENLKFGNDAFSDGDYYSASTYFFNVLQQDSSDISAAYKYAESCRLFNEYKNAEKWYSYVYNSSKNKEYPLAIFYMALMNKSNGRYSEAKNNFKLYYDANKTKDDYFTEKARHELESCDYALKILRDTLPLIIGHLSENVNTPYSEFGAQQLGDTTLVYSSLRPNSTDEFEFLLPNFYLTKIYSSKNTIAGWAVGKELTNNINDRETNNANSYYCNKRIYFTRCSVDKIVNMKCDIYVTEFKNGKWQEPTILNNKINLAGYTSTQPTLEILDDDGGEVLYFVSDRPGGVGKLDIWYSLIKNGKYNDPVNLGSIVNSPGDEISPFYYDETKTLYFSSDWHNGLGGYDIFKSKGGFNEWTTPENIGFPINTRFNETYFTINENDTDGFFTSNRPGSLYIKGETCCNDIWSYEWIKTKKIKKDTAVVVIKDTVSYEQNIISLLPLTLYFHNDIPDPASDDTITKLNYKTTLAEYIEMKQQYEKEYSSGLKGNDKTKAIKDIDEFFDNYVTNGFSKLEQFSEWLLKELLKGKDIKITVKGYCSPLHTTEYNIKLAKRRISSLVNYFRGYENGIFIKYMDNALPGAGRLEIYEEPVGKSQANPLVSDNPNDQRNSIYSRGAALERKIQILMYQSKDSVDASFKKNPEIFFNENTHDFGKITQGEKKVYSLTFRNTGDANLIISGVETSCGCIVTDFSKEAILPGAKGQLNILYDTRDEIGKKTETITVYSNALNTKKEINITSEVTPAPEIKKIMPQQKNIPQQKSDLKKQLPGKK